MHSSHAAGRIGNLTGVKITLYLYIEALFIINDGIDGAVHFSADEDFPHETDDDFVADASRYVSFTIRSMRICTYSLVPTRFIVSISIMAMTTLLL